MGERFGYTIVSFLTLWAACVIYLAPLDKRSHCFLRAGGLLVAGSGCIAAVCLLLPWSGWVSQTVVFCLAVLFFLICGDMPISAAIYCGIWAQVSQQLVAETCHLLYRLCSSRIAWGTPLWLGAAAILFVGCYCAIALTVSRWLPSNGRYTVGPRQFTLSVFFLIVFEVLLQMLLEDIRMSNGQYSVTILLAQYYCATMLYFQHTLFTKSAMRQELAILNRLWYEQKQQYELAKENIAIINRKCHDLKHQISAMRTMASHEGMERYIEEVEDSVRIYDSIFKTGNEVLDTVLTEKSLYCEANRIPVTCVADGSQLAFMDPVDIYAILGNALDNAIEGVQQLHDPEKRMIDVLICTRQQLLLLQVINPLEGELILEDGLPLSTKIRDGYHGFGLKSIRHTAEKYGGFMTVDTAGGQFALRVLIPLTGRSYP